MRKGDKITHEMFKTAIIACSGNILEMKKHLDLKTETSIYYLLANKFQDLKSLWLSVKDGSVNLDPELDTQLRAFASDLPPILTRIQLEIMDFIDTGGGESVRVTDFNSVHVKNLVERGFILLENGFAILTEDGDVARLNHMVYGSEDWYKELEKSKQPEKPKKLGRKPKPVAKINREAFMRPENGVVPSKPKSADDGDLLAEEAPIDTPCSDCDNCIHQEVLNFLVSNRPELFELVNEALKMKTALRNVRAEIEKLGWTR